MFKMINNSSIQKQLLFKFLFLATFCTVAMGAFGLELKFLFIFLGALLFFIAFFNTNFALGILIFSMLLSPEFQLGGISGRAVVLRLDDILILVVSFGWLAKMAVNKELGLLRLTPLNKVLLGFMLVYVIITAVNILIGNVTVRGSIFYLLKYMEYFLLYFVVSNSLRDFKQIRTFVYLMILVMSFISIYAWYQHLTGIIRPSAPFEGKFGEPNTLGGYLLLIQMIIIGLILNLSSLRKKIILTLVLFLSFPAFLFTLSRGSWLGFVVALLVLIILSKKGKLLLFAIFVVLATFFSIVMPKYVQERVEYTFSDRTQRTIMGREIGLDPSSAARIDTWRDAMRKWRKSPVMGFGAGSAGAIVDNQYARLLTEVGTIGFVAFVWMVMGIFKASLFSLQKFEDNNFISGLSAGFIAGFAGLLAHGLGAATFIIVRIMEPFWFLAAIVVMVPYLECFSEHNKRVV